MKTWIDKLFIARRLIRINSILIAFSISLILIGFLSVQNQMREETLLKNLEAKARIVAYQLSEALYNQDIEKIESGLKFYHSVENLNYRIFDNRQAELINKKTAATYHPYVINHRLFWPDNIKEKFIFSEQTFFYKEPIVYQGKQLGFLLLKAEIEPLNQATQKILWVALGVLVFSLLAGLFVFFKLREWLDKPVLKMSETLNAILDSADFSKRFLGNPDGNLNELSESLNRLICFVEKKNSSLDLLKKKFDSELDLRQEEMDILNQELKVLSESLKQANQQMRFSEEAKIFSEKKFKSKSAFLFNVSHEFKNVLSGVEGLIQSLKKTELDEDQSYYLELIAQSNKTLLTLIKDWVDFSQQEKISLETVDFAFQDLVEDVIGLLVDAAEIKQLELVYFQSEDFPKAVLGDPVRLKQVLYNLINNAIKFTDSGYVSVKSQLLSAQFNPETKENWACIRVEVSDSGIGMSEKFKQALFLDNSQSGKVGLALCHQMIQLMHGKIGVDSEENKGSTFWFEVELQCSEQNFWMHAPIQKTVCVIDDSEKSFQALSGYLHRLGLMNVQRLAVNELKSLQKNDALILDVKSLEKLKESDLQWLSQKQLENYLSLALMGPLQDKNLQETHLMFEWLPYLVKPFRSQNLKLVLEFLVGKKEWGSSEIKSDPKLWLQHQFESSNPEITQKVSVLLVETNLVNQKVAQGRLKRMTDYVAQVEVSMQWPDALKKLESKRYDVVFLDLATKDKAWLPVLKHIQQAKIQDQLPVLVVGLMASSQSDVRAEFLNAGGHETLLKPLLEEDVKALMSRYQYHWQSGVAFDASA